MTGRLITTLLGLCSAGDHKLGKNTGFKIAIAALLMIFSLQVLPAPVHATHIVTNFAGVDWTDNLGNLYTTIWDTASIRVFLQPDLMIAKDVKNITTGETDPDEITAIREDVIEFILTVTNFGNTSAMDVVVMDSIPVGTEYMIGTALDTDSIDPIFPPDTITFQHTAGGAFDINDAAPVTAIKWEWIKIGGIGMYDNGIRTIKFRVKVLD